jgi:hypothetical protein
LSLSHLQLLVVVLAVLNVAIVGVHVAVCSLKFARLIETAGTFIVGCDELWASAMTTNDAVTERILRGCLQRLVVVLDLQWRLMRNEGGVVDALFAAENSTVSSRARSQTGMYKYGLRLWNLPDMKLIEIGAAFARWVSWGGVGLFCAAGAFDMCTAPAGLSRRLANWRKTATPAT